MGTAAVGIYSCILFNVYLWKGMQAEGGQRKIHWKVTREGKKLGEAQRTGRGKWKKDSVCFPVQDTATKGASLDLSGW